MSRLTNFLLFFLVLIGAFWLYQVKHEAQEEEKKIATLEKQISAEKEALLLLKAEWSYLNRPQRVQRLVERFSDQLHLKAVDPHQIGSAADLPERIEGPALTGDDKQGLDAFLKNAQPVHARVE
ncbi:cell division protein FtsL [Cohaesibacter celericrescens]|uniref:cell division protein FtsL n=1 Tax=Cohaesibacter celericrescens TaxID=2067669 RepID=UPI0035630F05